MKKFVAILLTLMLVLGVSVAFAEDAAWDGSYAHTDETTFNVIEKTYTSENNVVVNETLSFTSTAASSNPDTTKNLTVADLTVASLNPGTLAVTIPSLDKAGVYEWTIKETAGNTAGVTYSNAEVHVIVLVEYDNEAHALKIANTASYIKKENGAKAKTFENTFKSGSFTVAKDVTGNMANETDEFEIAVTLTSTKPIGSDISVAGTTVASTAWTKNGDTYTYTFSTNYSKKNGAKAFSDIPEGVTVSVVENTADDKMNGYTYFSTNENKENTFSMTIADADANKAVVVTNDKTVGIDTGVTTESLPYVVLMGFVVLAGAALLLKRKAHNN